MSQRQIYSDLHLQVRTYKRIQLESGMFRREQDGYEDVTYDVYLSGASVEEMVRKAAASTGGKSRDGALEVRITKRRRL